MKKYCVIGYPIGHSLSPKIHNAAFKKLKIDAKYEAVEVKPQNLKKFMRDFKEKYAGANVTIPHKEQVIKYLDKISPEAKKIGAVNTIVNRGGKLVGHNTDVVGAMVALSGVMVSLSNHGTGFPFKNKNVVVLGAGGAARAVVYGLKRAGAKVTIVNRTISRAKKLAVEFGCKYEPKVLSPFDVLINTTSVGMWQKRGNREQGTGNWTKETPLPELSRGWLRAFFLNNGAPQPHSGLLAPLSGAAVASMGRSPRLGGTRSASLKLFKKNAQQPAPPVVMDIIYRPRMTKLLRDAKKAGCQIITGDKMFLAQAEASFKLFNTASK
jgi:shikimate dehydrogenase